MQNWTKVVSDCQKALEIDPKTVKGYFFLGQAHLELENYDESINYFKRGMNISFETCICRERSKVFNAWNKYCKPSVDTVPYYTKIFKNAKVKPYTD